MRAKKELPPSSPGDAESAPLPVTTATLPPVALPAAGSAPRRPRDVFSQLRKKPAAADAVVEGNVQVVHSVEVDVAAPVGRGPDSMAARWSRLANFAASSPQFCSRAFRAAYVPSRQFDRPPVFLCGCARKVAKPGADAR